MLCSYLYSTKTHAKLLCFRLIYSQNFFGCAELFFAEPNFFRLRGNDFGYTEFILARGFSFFLSRIVLGYAERFFSEQNSFRLRKSHLVYLWNASFFILY